MSEFVFTACLYSALLVPVFPPGTHFALKCFLARSNSTCAFDAQVKNRVVLRHRFCVISERKTMGMMLQSSVKAYIVQYMLLGNHTKFIGMSAYFMVVYSENIGCLYSS
jgi:hypothetical protein